MKIIYNRIFLEHNNPSHPENNSRLGAFISLPQTAIENGEKYLTLVHTRDYIEKIKSASENESWLDGDTYTSKGSFKAASFCVGASIYASQTSGFALVRPPGHHAHINRASGFCLFNNIAIACQNLINMGKKVLILDIDGHLGDGTEEFFYRSNRVLYLSLHQYPAYPFFGTTNQIGDGQGIGYTINLPLPPGSADDVYLCAFNFLIPIARQFQPDIVAVSAGFDTFRKDSLLNLKLSLSIYHLLGKIIADNFSSVFAVLEGGYNREFLPQCIFNFVDGINGKPLRFKEKNTVSSENVGKEFATRIRSLKNHLKSYWRI
ncbi:histone deacetylase [Candidatus Gottesmanbacteria bacterium RBG_16_37_8]|uniref:Histone deacetylase n=1 Tax=Candidatus Gottesmanbacteria bacterium RBG_16_37_8 TaxID=1798371 RepID=A0A1F5YTX7_9BACT|nr:MAG: histone deacetylase [Candidatus Gottesmanbacteria bacterium RBG_16_37_8]